LYVDDEIPSITVVEIAGILDQRICELTQANE
jgi:hypothetical protein